jgi:hypothetical protein
LPFFSSSTAAIRPEIPPPTITTSLEELNLPFALDVSSLGSFSEKAGDPSVVPTTAAELAPRNSRREKGMRLLLLLCSVNYFNTLLSDVFIGSFFYKTFSHLLVALVSGQIFLFIH